MGNFQEKRGARGNSHPAYADGGKMLVPEWATSIIGVLTLTLLASLFFAFR